MKLTAKGLKGRFEVVGIGYCRAQYLLGGELKLGYTANGYGWRSDNYLVKVDFKEGSKYVIVSTGYAPVSNVKANLEMLESLENKACNIYNDVSKSWEKRVKEIKKLLNKLLVDALGL